MTLSNMIPSYIIDVIEHIVGHGIEKIGLVSTFLKEGGHLIILVPAHNFCSARLTKPLVISEGIMKKC